MIRHHHALRWLFLVVPLALMVVAPAPARAELSALVPSYFDPGLPAGAAEWAAMTAAAKEIPITAILNPNSGPAGSPTQAYKDAMTSLEAAGGKVVAYVFTAGGNTPLNTVESQINTYIAQYGGLIQGIFLDGMNLENFTDSNGVLHNTIPYYQSIFQYIKGLNPSYTVIGNNGDPFLNGATPADFLSTADIINIFEGPNTAPAPGAPGFDAYPYGVTWFQSYPSSRFANIVHDAPASALLADLSKAVQFNAGSVFITDGTGGNPYGQLPSYWDQEVAAIQAINTPEPSSSTIVAVCGLLMAARFVPWRRGRLRRSGFPA
jgi:hypothetical protein